MTSNSPAARPSPVRPALVESLTTFLAGRDAEAIETVWVFRTSSDSRVNFEAAFNAGVALDPTDPDVMVLAQVGHRVVLDDGAADRVRLGAMELRHGSVAGGRGAKKLGWVVPIGASLFVLYLETARKADIPGATPDQSRNVFTEAVCEIVRTVRPRRVVAPAIHRLVRNQDFGTQLMRTFRTYGVEVHAGGTRLQLTGSDGELLSMVNNWFAATDASATVARLTGIEASIYSAGDWYLTTRFLPFTWRAKRVARVNQITGETQWTVPDGRDLEVTPGSERVFDEFIRMLGTRSMTLNQIGGRMGELGVTDRAPRNFAKPVPLNELRQPGVAISGLLQDRWLDAWRTGKYHTTVRLKSDLSRSHPGLAEAISEREDGSQWLDVEVDLPMPERGYWLTEAEYAAVVETRKSPTPQRVGRAASTGSRRPLSSLAQWDDPATGRQYRLATFDSSDCYSVLWRPLSEATDSHGHTLGWTKEQRLNKLAVVNADALHRSLANGLLRLDERLEGLIAPLVVAPRSAPSDAEAAAAGEATAAAQVVGLEARMRGIRIARMEALGNGERAEADRLNGDEALAAAGTVRCTRQAGGGGRATREHRRIVIRAHTAGGGRPRVTVIACGCAGEVRAPCPGGGERRVGPAARGIAARCPVHGRHLRDMDRHRLPALG